MEVKNSPNILQNEMIEMFKGFEYIQEYIGGIFLSLHRKMAFFVIGNIQNFLYNNIP